MRVEPYGVGSFIHVVKRGARGLPIIRDEADYRRFARLLYFLNDRYQSEFWEQSVRNRGMFERPVEWPKRRPLVKILAWTLMPNHFHLLLQEIQDGGTSRFMQRLCGSMSRHFNEKYEERGSIFQGAFRCRTVDSDQYLRWALSYVMVKNVFELFPGGFERACENFDKAWEWGKEQYTYSSFHDYASGESSPILDPELFRVVFNSPKVFKACSRDMVASRLEKLRQANESVVFE